MEKTIAAISTAMSASGIGIVRISGDEAMDVISRIYRSKNGKKNIREVQSHTIHAGELGVGCSDISKADIRVLGENVQQNIPERRKVVEVADAVEEVDSCSACYGYLIPALDMLKQEGLLEKLHEKICIGQGYRGKSGELGVGHCTRNFKHHAEGCPPTENQIYEFLKEYISK